MAAFIALGIAALDTYQCKVGVAFMDISVCTRYFDTDERERA